MIIEGAVIIMGNPSKINADGCVVLTKERSKSASGSASIAVAITVAEIDVNVKTAAIVFNVFGNNAAKLNPVNRRGQRENLPTG
jgi:hypothetical protein